MIYCRWYKARGYLQKKALDLGIKMCIIEGVKSPLVCPIVLSLRNQKRIGCAKASGASKGDLLKKHVWAKNFDQIIIMAMNFGYPG